MGFDSMKTKRLFAVFAMIGMVGAGLVAGMPKASAQDTSVLSGQLIRGATFPSVYYMGADGFRYPFPNDKTFFTWYTDFSDVVWISDAQLAEIPLGDANITYKPGVKLIKINSDARTFAIEKGGVIRHIETEEIAAELYGANWSQKVDDVPDVFWSSYTVGEPVSSPDDYDATDAENSVTDINDDKDMIAPEVISITNTGFAPREVEISSGQTVRFTNNDTTKHSIVAESGTWGSGTLDPGESFVRRFEEAGAESFYDGYDETSTGSVVIE